MNNSIVGSIAVHSLAEDVIEIKDEAENLEKKRSDSAASVLVNPFYLNEEDINENMDEVANSDVETYELLSDSEENESDSSEDDLVTPGVSSEEDEEMGNTASDENYVVVDNPVVGSFKLARLKSVLTNPK